MAQITTLKSQRRSDAPSQSLHRINSTILVVPDDKPSFILHQTKKKKNLTYYARLKTKYLSLGKVLLTVTFPRL